jgi:hypothetical protein
VVDYNSIVTLRQGTAKAIRQSRGAVARCDLPIKDIQVLIRILAIGLRHSSTLRAKHCPQLEPPKTSTRRNVLKRLGSTPGRHGIVLRVRKALRYCQYTKYRPQGSKPMISRTQDHAGSTKNHEGTNLYDQAPHLSYYIQSISFRLYYLLYKQPVEPAYTQFIAPSIGVGVLRHISWRFV